MKKIVLILWIAISYQLLTVNCFSQGLKNVIVEKYYISNVADTAQNPSGGTLPVGSVTYRIFAEMLPGYKFQAAYGISNPLHELRLATTTQFFNNIDRGALTANDISKTYLKNNTVMLDSWLSVGAGSAGNFGILKGDDTNGAIVNADGILQNADASAGIPVKTEDGLVAGTPQPVTKVGIDAIIGVFGDGSANGNLFSTTNGSWASLNGSVGPTADNRVLIAQITTDGVFTFELNIQIGTPKGDVENYVAKNPAGNEKQRDFLTYSSATTNMKPIVILLTPADSSSFDAGKTVAISAKAFDPDGTVSKVEFFVDGASIGSVNSTPYTINYSAVLGKHSIMAVATDNKGAKDTTKVRTIDGTVGVKDINAANSGIIVYPNPFTDELSIEHSVSGKVINSPIQINIYDIYGRLIDNRMMINNNNTTVSTKSFAKGEYILELNADSKRTYRKIIKN